MKIGVIGAGRLGICFALLCVPKSAFWGPIIFQFVHALKSGHFWECLQLSVSFLKLMLINSRDYSIEITSAISRPKRQTFFAADHNYFMSNDLHFFNEIGSCSRP